MSVAIVVPSIHAKPQALKRLREVAPDALIIVVGDVTAPGELAEYCKGLNAYYLGPNEQVRLPYLSVKTIPWKTIMRRNLGTLEALRLGADLLISVDDDNSPMDDSWFEGFCGLFHGRIPLTYYEAENGWFNIGDYADQNYFYRGFPYSIRRRDLMRYKKQAGSGRIGVANGLIYGDPDINATERIERNPLVKSYDPEIVRFGASVNPVKTWAPVDTQNTAYCKELIPLAFVLPEVGRYDDIWAGLIAQRIMKEYDYAVYYGPPSIFQTRNQHNPFRDLYDELYGMEQTEAFADCLKRAPCSAHVSTVQNLRRISTHLKENWFKSFPTRFLDGWICDLENLENLPCE